jgi:hypothetical protein
MLREAYPEYKLRQCTEARTHWDIGVVALRARWHCTQCGGSMITGEAYSMSYPGVGHVYCRICLDKMMATSYSEWVHRVWEHNYALFSLVWRHSRDVARGLGWVMTHIPKLNFLH